MPRRVLIVAHGSPSDPDPLDGAIRMLAAQVNKLLDGAAVTGATLAKEGSLERCLDTFASDELVNVYPFFMSSGWFVKRELRRRVLAATRSEVSFLVPFGLDGRIPSLCGDSAARVFTASGHRPEHATVVLAAHGSRKGHAAARAARSVATRMRWTGRFHDVLTGFVEEAPRISEVASGLADRPAVCLPLFATTAGHVTQDIPEQLSAADFKGAVLPPIGEHPGVPGLIADAIANCLHQSTSKGHHERALGA